MTYVHRNNPLSQRTHLRDTDHTSDYKRRFPTHNFITFLMRIALLTFTALLFIYSQKIVNGDLNSWSENFVQNFLTEVLGIAITVIVLDTIGSAGKLKLENIVMKIDQAVDLIDEAVEDKLQTTIETVAASKTAIDKLEDAQRQVQLQLATISAQLAILRQHSVVYHAPERNDTP